MSKVKVSATVSVDGFGAGPQQSLDNPQGVGGLALAEWAFGTRTFQRMHGKDWTLRDIHPKDAGATGIDDDFFARRFRNVGAFILGRNMFGPVLLGCGERLLGDINLVELGYTLTEHVAGERAMHVVLARQAHVVR